MPHNGYYQKLVEETSRINFKAPLNCWDIYMYGFQRNSMLLKDAITLKKYAMENKWNHAFNFVDKLFHQTYTIVVTDSQLNIVFASSNLFEMSGYLPKEVIGKRPHLFQGSGTDKQTKKAVAEAITERRPFNATLLNYKKNGVPYKCELNGYPVFNKKNELVNFIAFEKER